MFLLDLVLGVTWLMAFIWLLRNDRLDRICAVLDLKLDIWAAKVRREHGERHGISVKVDRS
jgi:hypothetical protein